MIRPAVIAVALTFILFSPPAEAFFHARLFPQTPIGPDTSFSDRSSYPSTYYMGWWGGSQPRGQQLTADLIEKFYMPEAMKMIPGLCCVWDEANTPLQNIPFRAQFNAQMDLLDRYGMVFLMRTPISGYRLEGTWGPDMLEAYPDMRTFNQFGAVSQFIRTDHPQYANQLYEDMKQLYDLYGHHPSWVGFAQSDLFSDAPRWDGGGCSACGVGTRVFWMLGPDSARNWYNSDFRTPISQDDVIFNGDGTPKVGIPQVFDHIMAFHEVEWRAWVSWTNETAFDQAIKRLETLSGKKWVFATRDRINENFPKMIKGNSVNGNPITSAKLLHLMRSVSEQYLEGTHHITSPLFFSSQSNFPNQYKYTEDELRTQLGFLYPFTGGQPAQWLVGSNVDGSTSINNPNSLTYAIFKEYGDVMNRMLNVGSFWGIEDPSAPRVLLIQSGGRTASPSQILTASLNITYVDSEAGGTSQDPATLYHIPRELSKFPNLSQFDVIVFARAGTSGKFSPTSGTWDRIVKFVQSGGGLVLSGYSDSQTAQFTSSLREIADGHKIYSPYLKSQVSSGGYAKTISTQSFGLGRVVNIPSPYTNGLEGLGGGGSTTVYSGSPKDSFVILLNNAIHWASKQDSKIPTYWHDQFKTGSQFQSWKDSTLSSPTNS